MSYAITNRAPSGLGFEQCSKDCCSGIGPTVEGQDSKAIVTCCDFCCDGQNWSNITYLKVKGALSFRYKNENRFRHLLAVLANGGVTQAAYDVAAVENYPLQEAVKRASAAFEALWPLSRWAKIPKVVKWGDCLYSRWEPSGASPMWQATVESYLGVGFTPEAYAGHFGPIDALTDTVPGSGLEEHADGLPLPESALTVASGKVAPSAWLASVLAILAPGWEKKLTVSFQRGTLTRKATTKIAKQTVRVQAMVMKNDEAPEESSGIPWLWVGVIGGAAVAVGIWRYVR